MTDLQSRILRALKSMTKSVRKLALEHAPKRFMGFDPPPSPEWIAVNQATLEAESVIQIHAARAVVAR